MSCFASFAISRQCVDPITGKTMTMPTTWPGSEDVQWVNKMVELRARNIETPQDVEAWYSKSKLDLSSLLQQQSIPKGFVKLPWNSQEEHRLSDKWEWKHIKQQGYVWGNKLPDSVAARQPFCEWEVLIGLIAQCVASSRAVMGVL